jgi:hypothetical protein
VQPFVEPAAASSQWTASYEADDYQRRAPGLRRYSAARIKVSTDPGIGAEFLACLRQRQGALQGLPLGMKRKPGWIGFRRCLDLLAAHDPTSFQYECRY